MSGPTQSGKTPLVCEAIVRQMQRQPLTIVSYLVPENCRSQKDLGQIYNEIATIWQFMEEREKNHVSAPPILLVLDGLQRDFEIDVLSDIVLKGRIYGITVWVTTQANSRSALRFNPTLLRQFTHISLER